MAIYEAGPGSPVNSQRIDGQQWTIRAGGGTIHGSGYPTSSPSDQFNEYNENAINLDRAFDDLTTTQQNQWNAKAAAIDDVLFCTEEEYYYG